MNFNLSGSHAACHFEAVPLLQSGPSNFRPPLNPTGNTDTPTVFLICTTNKRRDKTICRLMFCVSIACIVNVCTNICWKCICVSAVQRGTNVSLSLSLSLSLSPSLPPTTCISLSLLFSLIFLTTPQFYGKLLINQYTSSNSLKSYLLSSSMK